MHFHSLLLHKVAHAVITFHWETTDASAAAAVSVSASRSLIPSTTDGRSGEWCHQMHISCMHFGRAVPSCGIVQTPVALHSQESFMVESDRDDSW